jgi:hypothetical protein
MVEKFRWQAVSGNPMCHSMLLVDYSSNRSECVRIVECTKLADTKELTVTPF